MSNTLMCTNIIMASVQKYYCHLVPCPLSLLPSLYQIPGATHGAYKKCLKSYSVTF